MSLILSFHRSVVCRAIPEMSELDAGAANAVTTTAVKNIPFKDNRNWIVFLLLLLLELPLIIYVFFAQQLSADFGISTNLLFLITLALSLLAVPICWYALLRVIRQEILAILANKSTTAA